MTMPVLSPLQQEAAGRIDAWLDRPCGRRWYYLAGYAGVGKTTLVTRLGHERQGLIYAAFTGKAASRLRELGSDGASTLHRLIYYEPLETCDERGRVRLEWTRRTEPIRALAVVADECSMIDGTLAEDLLAVAPKVLVTGDLNQLPPVHGEAYFTRPDFVLDEIHRQAEGAQPLELAMAIHEDRPVTPIRFDLDRLLAADIVICALNDTRRRLNRLWRKAHGVDDRYPVVGDQVLCFKNNYETGVFNGQLWTVERVGFDGDLISLALLDDTDDAAEVVVHERDFLDGAHLPGERDRLDRFDYGYAITCHKSQGSEWPRVVVIDETRSPKFRYMAGNSRLAPAEFTRRWLYTAVTRAIQHVDIMEPPR
jgi:exodeoxyribonuclease-5